MNTEIYYRGIVDNTLRSQMYYIHSVLYYRDIRHSKKLAWLRLLGLMETWDIKNDRN